MESAPERAPVPAILTARAHRAASARRSPIKSAAFNASALIAVGVSLVLVLLWSARSPRAGAVVPAAPHNRPSPALGNDAGHRSPVSPFGTLTPLGRPAPDAYAEPADSSAFILQSDSEYASTQSDWRDAASDYDPPESNLTPVKTSEPVRAAPQAASDVSAEVAAAPNFDGRRRGSSTNSAQTDNGGNRFRRRFQLSPE